MKLTIKKKGVKIDKTLSTSENTMIKSNEKTNKFLYHIYSSMIKSFGSTKTSIILILALILFFSSFLLGILLSIIYIIVPFCIKIKTIESYKPNL